MRNIIDKGLVFSFLLALSMAFSTSVHAYIGNGHVGVGHGVGSGHNVHGGGHHKGGNGWGRGGRGWRGDMGHHRGGGWGNRGYRGRAYHGGSNYNSCPSRRVCNSYGKCWTQRKCY